MRRCVNLLMTNVTNEKMVNILIQGVT